MCLHRNYMTGVNVKYRLMYITIKSGFIAPRAILVISSLVIKEGSLGLPQENCG